MTKQYALRCLVALGSAVYILLASGCRNSEGDVNLPKTESQPESGGVDQSSVVKSPTDILASWDTGAITRGELDEAVLAMPANQRHRFSDSSDAAFGEGLRELAFDRILLEKARLEATTLGERFDASERRLRRSFYVQGRLLELNLKPRPTTVEDLRALYDERADEFQRAERRMVLNIFKRAVDEESLDEARAVLSRVRGLVNQGQGFSALASQYSDSETRHADGRLGWFSRGQLPDELDHLVFSLEQDAVSDIVKTATGVHLFFVETIIPARETSFEEAESKLANELGISSVRQQIEEVVDELQISGETFVMSETALAQLRAAMALDEVVLLVGDWTLTLAELLDLHADAASARTQQPPDLYSLLQSVKLDELIYQHSLENGWQLPELQRAELDAEIDLLRLKELRSVALSRFVDSKPEALERYYRNNGGRFGTPGSVQLKVLRIPRRADQADAMSDLEAQHTSLDSGETSLEDMARKWQGVVVDWQPISLAELRRRRPRVAAAVAPVDIGHHSNPLTTVTHIESFRVLRREVPALRPYSEVSETVRDALIRDEGQMLYLEMRADELGRRNFQGKQDL